MSPVFSVVVPTFDRPRKLEECLAALARLEYPRDDYEVVVVDDGSREPVKVAGHGAAVRVERRPNAGPAAARNRGVAAARGRWVAFTDDDCRPAADWLTMLERPLLAGAAAVAGRAVNALPDIPFATASQELIDHLLRWYNRDPADARFGTTNNMAVDREVLGAAGGFDESFSRAAGEDRELVHRLREGGHRIAYEPRARVEHHHDLHLRGFLRQHHAYGRAAALFRRRAGRVPVEPPAFYRELVRAPEARISALLVVAQVANAAGFAHESARLRLG